MTPNREADIVSLLCLALSFLCLGTSVFLIATGRINRALLPVSFVLLIFRFDLWFQRRQQAPEQKEDDPINHTF